MSPKTYDDSPLANPPGGLHGWWGGQAGVLTVGLWSGLGTMAWAVEGCPAVPPPAPATDMEELRAGPAREMADQVTSRPRPDPMSTLARPLFSPQPKADVLPCNPEGIGTIANPVTPTPPNQAWDRLTVDLLKSQRSGPANQGTLHPSDVGTVEEVTIVLEATELHQATPPTMAGKQVAPVRTRVAPLSASYSGSLRPGHSKDPFPAVGVAQEAVGDLGKSPEPFPGSAIAQGAEPDAGKQRAVPPAIADSEDQAVPSPGEVATDPPAASLSEAAPEPDPLTPGPEETVELDPDLGIIRLRLPEAEAPEPPVLYVLGDVDFFSSNNIFSELFPVPEQPLRTGVSLLLAPQVGPDTSLFALVGGSLVRYTGDFAELSYDELTLQGGVRQTLSPQMYGQVSWRNQQLFPAEGGSRFYNDHSFEVLVGRWDSLGSGLNLNSFYQGRLSLTDPDDFNRIIHDLGLTLNYNLTPDVITSLSYQLTLADFTLQPRFDVSNQILAEISYGIFDNVDLSVYGGFRFGGSTDPLVNFNDTVYGINLSVSFPVF